MNIKSVGPHRYRTKSSPFKQGYFQPMNKEKCVGPFPIIYRSSWELKVCKYLDENINVIRWGSECIEIPYYSTLDNKMHNYYPDFYFEYLNDNQTKKVIIEVKPKTQLLKPEKPKVITEKSLANYKRAATTYVKNMEKAVACKRFCEKRGYDYKFVTEESNLKFI